jgi:hypothetical protein
VHDAEEVDVVDPPEGVRRVDSKSPIRYTPALFTHASTWPKRSRARRARSATAFSSTTSVGSAIALPPAATHSSATVSSASARRAATTTPQPDSAKRRAVARPIPLDAPVTTAILMALRGTRRLLDETPPRNQSSRSRLGRIGIARDI